MKNKALTFLLIVFLSPLIAGIYGIIHDQITYTLAPEYYTKFKYIQFDISEHLQNRVGVGIVGFAATWWVGLLLGLVFGGISFVQINAQRMWTVTLKCIFYTLLITALMGAIGYCIGRFAMDANNFYFPDDVTDKQRFLAVGMVHNLGYLGGVVGLITGIVIQLKSRKKAAH